MKDTQEMSNNPGIHVVVYLLLTDDRISEQPLEQLKTCPAPVRADAIHKKCSVEDHTEVVQPGNFSLLLVDSRHKVLYCAIPKAATTSLKTAFAEWTGLVTQSDIVEHQVESPSFMESIGLQYLNAFNMTEIRRMLKDYFKVLVVRHPFVRLVSAYRDKIRRTTTYGQEIKQRIVEKYVHNSSQGLRWERVGIPFKAFVDYVIHDSKGLNDHHWGTVQNLCFPCQVNYDCVAKVETLREDYKWLEGHFHKKLPPLRKLNARVHDEATRVLKDLKEFFTLDQGQREQLKTIYKSDLTMFGYSDDFLQKPGCMYPDLHCC